MLQLPKAGLSSTYQQIICGTHREIRCLLNAAKKKLCEQIITSFPIPTPIFQILIN